MSHNLTGKYSHWYFPLSASYPKYLNAYLDRTIGINEYHNEQERENFVQSLFSSLSLNIYTKKKLLHQYSVLSPFQLDELGKVWQEESDKFAILECEHPNDINRLNSNNIIEWIFILDLDDLNSQLQEVLYQNKFSKDVINRILGYVSDEEIKDKYEIFKLIFEDYEDKEDINEENWNHYIYSLCQLKEFNKSIQLKIPKKISSPFLEACKVVYVLEQGNYNIIKKEDLKPVYQFLRLDYSPEVKAQFLDDIYNYYFYQDKNFDKFLHRYSKLFKSSIKHLEIEKSSLEFLIKPFSYIKPLIAVSEHITLRKTNEYQYLIFKKKLDYIEDKLKSLGKEAHIYDFYSSSEVIFNTTSTMAVNVSSFIYINKILLRNKEASLSPYTSIIYYILTSTSPYNIECFIDSYISNSNLTAAQVSFIYLILKIKKMDIPAKKLLKAKRKTLESTQNELFIDMIINHSSKNIGRMLYFRSEIDNTIKSFMKNNNIKI